MAQKHKKSQSKPLNNNKKTKVSKTTITKPKVAKKVAAQQNKPKKVAAPATAKKKPIAAPKKAPAPIKTKAKPTPTPAPQAVAKPKEPESKPVIGKQITSKSTTTNQKHKNVEHTYEQQ